MEKQSSLGLFGILKEAFKIGIRNGRLLLFVTLIMFSYFTVMGVADMFVLLPMTKDFVAHAKLLPKNTSYVETDPALHKAILKDIRFFLAYEFVMLSFLCLILMFSVAASVHSTFEAYTAKVLSLKDMLLGTRGRWKRALTTSIWMIIISLASAALLFFAVGVIGIMAEGSVLRALNWGVAILGGFYAVYLSSLWMLGLVVSVMEENLSGLKAIAEAHELMKGKRVKGFVLMALMILAGGATSMAFYFIYFQATHDDARMGVVVDFLAIRVPKNLAYCVWKVFVFVVYTLFYHECKMSKIDEENRTLYAPMAAVAEF